MSQVKRQSYAPDTATHSDSEPQSLHLSAPALLGLVSLALVIVGIILLLQSTHASSQFQNIFSTLNRTSNISHGESVGETLENIRHEECEIVVAFDANGRKLFEHTSSNALLVTMPVDLQEIYIKQGGYTLAHNHPGSDVPFSSEDLSLAAKLNVCEAIVVSAHYTYTMKPAGTGWPKVDEITSWFQDLYSSYPDDEQLWTFLPTYDNETNDSLIGIGTTDYLMELYVQEFGGTYTKSAVPFTNTTLVDPPRD